MEDMSAEAPAESYRAVVKWVAVVAAIAVVFVIWQQMARAAEHDRTVDEFYCTMSNVGPLDRAPNSGKSCLDIRMGR